MIDLRNYTTLKEFSRKNNLLYSSVSKLITYFIKNGGIVPYYIDKSTKIYLIKDLEKRCE